MALMEHPESHTDAELHARYPHHEANPEVANTFSWTHYRFLARNSEWKYWIFPVPPADFFHFHRWN